MYYVVDNKIFDVFEDVRNYILETYRIDLNGQYDEDASGCLISAGGTGYGHWYDRRYIKIGTAGTLQREVFVQWKVYLDVETRSILSDEHVEITMSGEELIPNRSLLGMGITEQYIAQKCSNRAPRAEVRRA